MLLFCSPISPTLYCLRELNTNPLATNLGLTHSGIQLQFSPDIYIHPFPSIMATHSDAPHSKTHESPYLPPPSPSPDPASTTQRFPESTTSYADFRSKNPSSEHLELQDRTKSLPGGVHSGGAFRRHAPGKRTWANVRLALRFLSLVCSILTGIAIGFVLATFTSTRHDRWRDELLWPKDPQLVPTIYMMAAASITVLVHIGLIISHFVNRERYLTEAYTKRDRIATVIQLLLGATWLVGGMLASIYKKDKVGERNDLWSWSCTSDWQLAGNLAGKGNVGADGPSWDLVCRSLRGAYTSAVSYSITLGGMCMDGWSELIM